MNSNSLLLVFLTPLSLELPKPAFPQSRLLVFTYLSPMQPPLRIAVLECDEPIGHTKEKYGGYGNLFKELLENGVRRYPDLYTEKAPELEVSKFDVVNTEHYPRLEDVDAILLTGSST